MASKRELKKDVDSLIFEIVSESYSFIDIYPKDDHTKAEEIIDNAMELQDETITSINNADKSLSAKETRKYFNELKTEFIQKVEALFKELDKLFEEQDKQDKAE